MTAKQPPVNVTPEPGSRLEQLHARYEMAKAKADEAEAELKTITDAIKAEALALVDGNVTAIELTHWAGVPIPLRLTYVESWRVDAKRLKAEDPVAYAMYATKSGTWQLRKAAG